jgi:hypothetical protein
MPDPATQPLDRFDKVDWTPAMIRRSLDHIDWLQEVQEAYPWAGQVCDPKILARFKEAVEAIAAKDAQLARARSALIEERIPNVDWNFGDKISRSEMARQQIVGEYPELGPWQEGDEPPRVVVIGEAERKAIRNAVETLRDRAYYEDDPHRECIETAEILRSLIDAR